MDPDPEGCRTGGMSGILREALKLLGEMQAMSYLQGNSGDEVGKLGSPSMPRLRRKMENRSLIFCALLSILDRVRALIMMMCRRRQKPSHIVPADVWKKRCSFPQCPPGCSCDRRQGSFWQSVSVRAPVRAPLSMGAPVWTLCRSLAEGGEVSQFQRRKGMKRCFMCC